MSVGSEAVVLDGALPGLAEAVEPSAVARRFRAEWPAPGPAPLITGCIVEHLRWTPGSACVAVVRLAFAGDASTLGVVTVRPDGVHHRLFGADADLPGLAQVTDPSVMGPWLAEQTDRALVGCAVTPVRYRPGIRCVLRYDAGGEVVFGKVLGGGRAIALAGVVEGMAERQLTMPLVGFSAAWDLVVQADAGPRRLSGGDAADLYASGRLLGRLHAGRKPPGPVHGLDDDLDDLAGFLPEFRHAGRSVEACADAIGRLRERAEPDRPRVPSHGAFRLDQVHGPVMIDLDSFTWAEPERDIANLLAYLRWRSMRRAEETGAESRAAFLAGYQREASVAIHDDRIRVYEAASLLKIAGRRYRRLKTDEWALVPDLVATAHRLLDAGAPG